MRILYHHRTLGDGAEGIHIREMVKAFRELGHDVKVSALIGEDVRSEIGSKQTRWARIRRLVPGAVYDLAEIGYNPIGARSVSKAVESFHPDIIYDRYNSYATVAVNVGRKTGIPVVLEVNAPVAYERSVYTEHPLLSKKLAVYYERRILTLCSHIVTVSSPLREFLVKRRGIDRSKISVVPNGADPLAFHPGISGASVRSRYGLNNAVVIGFSGILREWHGVELLLQAFQHLSEQMVDARLLIIGDGPAESQLRAKAHELRIENLVSFAGRVPHSRIAEHLAAMDISVSPQATFYASPMKILEYMAMGIAVVAPRMPNIEDILEEGKDSLLFEPGNEQSLFETLHTLCRDGVRRQNLGHAARRKVELEMNWRRNAETALAIARNLLDADGC